MKEMKRVLALLLCFVMLVGYVPVGAFATEEDATAPSVEETIATEATDAAVETTGAAQTETTAVAEEIITFDLGVVSAEAMGVDSDLDDINTAMERAKTYINALTINNSSNDPATVVKNFKTHFTWDNEKRENSKSYLFDWSYYNGVVFEGLEYLYEATGEAVYKDYVMAYMSSLIASNGTWAKCTNSGYTSKECAGYDSTHGADCYKTASLLLDAYEMSGDSRYLTIAATLYADLDTAAANSEYNLSAAGNNYRHTWKSDSDPDLWLDGLYMILPFRAEYAKHINDTEELDLIVDRLQWVSDNMCDDEGDANDTGLFYHAADNANSDSGTFWLRSIGWYAAAIVDVMDSMEGENLEAMKVQLKKLADNMIAHQNGYGMWLNNMKASESSTNPYETSGTALVCYAIMKGVNKGWLAEEYADAALLALRGITTKKLDSTNTNLTHICFKGAPGSSNSTFYDNEGKGVGPFIMLYAEVVKYFAEEELPVVTVTFDHANADRFEATGKGLTSIEAVLDETTDYSTIFDTNNAYGAYDIRLGNFPEGETVELTMSIYGVAEENLVVYKINADGSKTEIADVEVFCSEDLSGYLNATFDIESAGIYAMGTRFVEIPEGAVLTKVEITEDSATVYYFVEEISALSTLSLDITDLVVEATYSNGEETVTKEIYWDEFGAVENGYSLTFDMTQLGKQDVVVSYTYGGVTLTDTFGIEIFERIVQDEAVPEVKLELTIPGPVTMNVQENSQDEVVKAALENIVTTYIAFKFTLEGYTQGDEVIVTLPLPEGEGVGVAYYVPEDGSAPRKIENAVENADGTITFTTDHFSTYASGRATPVTGNGNLVGGTTYKLDTNGVTANKNYLIVNTGSDGTGYALTNNGSNTPGSTTVTIEGGKITVDDDSKIAWVFSGSTSGTAKNSTRYVYLGSSDVLSTSTRTLTINNRNNGAYRIYRTNSTYCLCYNNGSWSRTGTPTNVYLFEYDSASSGEAVTFSLSHNELKLQPNQVAFLAGTVTVNNVEVDLADCDITWASSDTRYVTVSDGTVSGLRDGTANVTATLTAVEGKALATPIILTVPVKVETLTVSGVELRHNSGTVYVGSGAAANTHAVIRTTYSDGTYFEEYVTLNMLSGKTISTAAATTYNDLIVTYNGTVYSRDFTLHVVEKPDMNFPEFPDPGSVMLDKYIKDASQFQNAGVAEVNLVTSGLPVHTGVDVILVSDLSNSMAWEVGGYKEDAETFAETKMKNLQTSITSFANTFLLNDDGSVNDNTISLVTFGGYDAQYSSGKPINSYADPTRTLLLGSNSVQNVQSTIEDVMVLREGKDGAPSNSSTDYWLSFDGGETWGENYGNTNYDYAFMEAYSAVNALKAKYQNDNGISYAESGRSIYILFMTDGAPTNYGGVYYQSKSGADRADNLATWVNEAGETVTYTKKTLSGNNVDARAAEWYKIIAGGTYNETTDSVPGNPLYWATRVYNMDNVADLYAIGFDIDNGGFSDYVFTTDSGLPLTKVLEKIVDGKTVEVHEATDASGLEQVYAKLASELKLAATNAFFMDQMGDNFNIQMASTVTKFAGTSEQEIIPLNPVPKITVTTYEIYTPDDVNGTTVTDAMVGQRKSSSKTVAEEVTFNPEGTEAYSNQAHSMYVTNADGTIAANATNFAAGANMLVNGVIYAKNFWYNTTKKDIRIDTNNDGILDYTLPAETFRWNIGTISNTEFVMSYYVYLDGSAQGEKPEGTYATNNYATLYYKNWLGNDVSQDIQSPSLAWQSASVNYGFYLVDKYGNPVTNRATGATGNIENAVKVTSKIFYGEVYLNEIEEFATIEVASTNVPEGYSLFDNEAAYTIKISSNSEASGWTITNTNFLWKDTDGDGVKDPGESSTVGTTYVTDYRGSEYSNVVDSDNITDKAGFSYTSTTVWFAVIWEPQSMPDVVVIDYGLPVDIGVLENDMFGTGGTLIGIGNKQKKPVSLKNSFTYVDSTDFVDAELKLNYGTAEINGTEVRYTPTTMAMNSYDEFTYEVRYNNVNTVALEYYYGDVTVIPATIIYYEATFTDVKVENGTTTTTRNGITYSDNWVTVGEEYADATQQEDRPDYYNLPIIDANNVYGYDAIYAETAKYSLGSSHMVNVTKGNPATAKFDFYGTGFDVISKTSGTTGTIIVTVSPVNADGSLGTAVKKHVVDTYYGYAYGEHKNEAGETVTGWYPVSDSDADANALFQVPVMKVEGLTYGRYNVEIKAAYEKLFDHTAENDSYDFYLDAIRIYDPAGTGAGIDDVIENAYKADNEAYPEYHELRNLILSAKDYDVLNGEKEGVIFIDNTKAPNGQEYSIANYQNFGPNNELYLLEGQTVAFNLNLGADGKYAGCEVADVQLAAKSADGGTVYLKMARYNQDKELVTSSTGKIATATDRYYSIGNYVDKAGTTILSFSNVRPEGVTGDIGILSITNIKITFSEVPNLNFGASQDDTEKPNASLSSAGIEEVVLEPLALFTVSHNTGEAVLAALNYVEEAPLPEPIEPEATEPEATEPEPTEPEATEPEVTEPEETEPEETLNANLQVSIRNKNIKLGSTVVVMATTSRDVDVLTVNGKRISHYVENRRTGVRTWTTTVKAEEVGDLDIEITAFSAKGHALETVVEQVTVTGKKASVVEQIVGAIIGVLLR